MATISFNATNAPTSLNRTRTKTLSGADALRIVAAARIRLNLPAASVDVVVDAIGDHILAQIARWADDNDRDVAAKAAADAVVPVALT